MSTTPQATLDDLGWWKNFPVSTVGPASPLQRSQPATKGEGMGANDAQQEQELASVTSLPAHTADHDTVPLPRQATPPRESSEPQDETNAGPAALGPKRQPNPTSTTDVSPVQHPRLKTSGDEMEQEPLPPNYWGARLLSAVYWIAILTGAGGQTAGFGAIFKIGAIGYAGAAVIATTAETIMIAAGDTALKLRAQGAPARQWVPFMLFAFAGATAAAGMNVWHFAGIRVEMAVLLGGISFLGFLLHFCKGFIDSTNYRQAKREYDQRVAELREREAAEAKQQRQQQEARQRREANRQHDKETRAAEANAPRSIKIDEIVRYALEHGLGARDAKRAFAECTGVPSERTIQRALSSAKAQTKAVAAS